MEVLPTDVLLGIIPGSSRVRCRNGHLHRRDQRTGKKSGKSLNAEEKSDDDRSEDYKAARGDHLLEGGVSCNLDAFRVLFSLCVAWVLLLLVGFLALHLFDLVLPDLNVAASLGKLISKHAPVVITSVLGVIRVALESLNLATHFLNHGVSSHSDGLHSHGTEPVWDHSPDKQPGELKRLKEIDRGKTNSVNKRTKERERNHSSRGDGKTLSNGSSGVTGGIKLVGALSYVLWESRHLGNTSGIVGDGAIGINGETNSEGGKDTQCRHCNPKHVGKVVRDEDVERQKHDREDTALVAEGKSVDDIRSCAALGAGERNILHWLVRIRGVVFSKLSNGKSRPKSRRNADENMPILDSFLSRNSEFGGKEDGADNPGGGGHEDCGHNQLSHQNRLNALHIPNRIDVGGQESGEEANDDSSGHKEHWECHVGPLLAENFTL
mmetsp:Transcript_25935/g.62470  ORF Transcript_25935/g.62470 Transcript_25935/m.62470 type:complete len:437 (+) Transcript_25935:522-1832(+)